MPGTIQTLVVFALFIVPGFLLRSGYVRTRAHGSAQADLYAIAEAVVGSLFLLAASWWLKGKEILEWAEDGTLSDHKDTVYFFVLGLLLAPYLICLGAGGAVNTSLRRFSRVRQRVRERPDITWRDHALNLIDGSGILLGPTVWDMAWNQLLAENEGESIFVRVGTRSGDQIVGAFEGGSWVGLSPEPRQIFLNAVYREEDDEWTGIQGTRGVLLDAEQIEYIEFVVPER